MNVDKTTICSPRFFFHSFAASDGSEVITAGRVASLCLIMVHHSFGCKEARCAIKQNIDNAKQYHICGTGFPQGGVLSPTLFNIYMSDLPTPPRDIHVTTYADDITIYSSDKNYTIAQQRLQPYLEDVQTWTKANDLKLNASKTMTTLFTPDPAEYRDELSLQLDNTRLPTIRNPKILGLTFDPKLTFN